MEKLIRRCQKGDRASMGRLYTVMHDELLAHCRKYVPNDNTAEDLLHDAFLLIFSNINKVRSPEKGRQWMHKVVKNVCLLYVQHRQNRTWVPIDEVRETVQSPEPDILVNYDEIVRAIDQLPRGYRQVFRLSVLEGLTHQQIAELLGIAPHTSSSQLLRAKRQLQQMLQVLMLCLLAALPLGGYYYWSLQNKKHDVAEESGGTSTNTHEILGEPHGSQGDSTEQEREQDRVVNKNHTGMVASLPTIAAEDTAICRQTTEIAAKAEVKKTGKDVVVSGNDSVEKHAVPVFKIETTPLLHQTHSSLGLSLAYSGLPSGSARQLPFGAEGMNGDIDSVTHHRMPITVALNIRYPLGAHWWLDGGLRYTQLSSETRVGNTYIYMERQQRVSYLGLSLGIGHHLWHHHHWSLYATASLICEWPLPSTEDISYWMGDLLIDRESVRLSPRTQWSVGAGIGLQYDLTPSVGFFAEPCLQYDFPHSDGIHTWRTEHPFTPALPLGVRISF